MKIYLIVIFSLCFFLVGRVNAQSPCSPAFYSLRYCASNVLNAEARGKMCISANVDPNEGFIIGRTYTFTASYDNLHPTTYARNQNWSSVSDSRMEQAFSVSEFDVRIEDEETCISTILNYRALGILPLQKISGELYIRASYPQPPYEGLCVDQPLDIGLKTMSFEEDAEVVWQNWKRKKVDLQNETVIVEPVIKDFSIPEDYAITPYGNSPIDFNNTHLTGFLNFNPFPTFPNGIANESMLVLGVSDDHGDDTENYQSIVEQTFFIGELYDPKLDIWFSWVTDQYTGSNDKIKKAPVFAIKVFRLYQNGVDTDDIIEEEVYSYTETQLDGDKPIAGKIWRHWWDKKTIDLTPYKLEKLKIQFISYDRPDPENPRVYNSTALVDISSSTCCMPLEVRPGVSTQLVKQGIANGMITFARPLKVCEFSLIALNADRRCKPTFFYQVIYEDQEPYIIEGKQGETQVRFRVPQAGNYKIRYKEDSSCCWSEFQPFEVLDYQVQKIDFSNDLKGATISCVPSFQLDKVLSVNVASFADRQFVEPKDITTSTRSSSLNEIVQTAPKNPFLTGERGIWRTEASYAYVTDRLGANDALDTLTKQGGTFNLNMFSWKTQGIVPKNWRRVNHVSRYDGYTHELENRDILGRYSSALYGYNGQLATAVASNAAYYEIANEGFEGYQESDEERVPAGIIPSDQPIPGENNIPHGLNGYEVGKKYAFIIDDRRNCIRGYYIQWNVTGSAILHRLVDTKTIIVEMMPGANNEFFISFTIPTPCYEREFSSDDLTTLCVTGYVQKAQPPIETETNFQINNLYEEGDKDRNIILQVLWAQGNKGILEGYTPGIGNPVTLDASVLAYTLGKQKMVEILPKFVLDPNDNKYKAEEEVSITLTHRDANTSWFTINPKGTYELPEEWEIKQEEWYGSIRLARTLPSLNDQKRNYRALTSTGHTGNQSLVPSIEPIIQEKLLLIPGKEYVFSAWVKKSGYEKQPYTYGGTGVDLKFYDVNGNLIPLAEEITINSSGAIIEGWQRIEGTFIVPNGSFFISTHLLGLVDQVAYDDIRIYPANGMMKTYVYNPSNYLLQAVLDENNYATLYFYDEEQRLYLVQKETREGVLSIQETRSYIKEK